MSPNKRLSAPPSPKKTVHPPSVVATVSPLMRARKALASCSSNPNRALKNIQETITNHGNIPCLHYTEALIHLTIARNISSVGMKQKSLKHAANSAKKALELAPDSIKYFHCLCLVLFVLARINGEYQEVIEECCRGLAIENPQDPGFDRLQEEGFLRGSTKEERVERVKNQIRDLIGAVEKERNQKYVEVEAGVCRNGGIVEGRVGKKRAKKLARFMAEELLQKKLDVISEARSKKVEEKYVKGSNRIRRVREPPDQVWDFWKRMSAEEKFGLLKVNIDELKSHFDSSKNELADQILMEAVEYVKQEKKWKYWKCCLCAERFADSESWDQHARSKKVWTLQPQLEKMISEVAADKWIRAVENAVWKPMDIFAMLNNDNNAAKRLEGSSENGLRELAGCNSEVRLENIDEKHKRKSCDDSREAELIKSIHEKLQFLLQRKSFSMSHLGAVMDYTIGNLPIYITKKQIEDHGLDQTLQSICFLQVPQLLSVLKFLQELATAVSCTSICGDDEDSALGVNEECYIIPNIDLSSDFMGLILDERLLLEEHFTGLSGSQDHRAARISTVDPHVKNELTGSDGFLKWLFGGRTNEEHLHEWTSIKEVRRDLESVVLNNVSVAFAGLHTLCDEKYQQMGYMRALQDVQSKYLNERNKDHPESFLLRLVKGSNALTEEENLQLIAITNILKEAEAIRQKQFHSKISLTDGTLLWHDEEYQEDHAEIYIQKAIKNQKDLTTYHIHKLDAKILLWKDYMQQLEKKFKFLSTYDYQPPMVHLLKSFIQVKMETLARNDAMQRSDAAEKALLARLSIDDEKNITKACPNARKTKGKSKDKRKNKKQNNSKNSKGTLGSELEIPLCEETIEEDCSITPADHTNTEISSSVNAKEMITQQEYEEANQRLDKVLEYQRQFEEEAREKHLQKQEELVGICTKHTTENLQVVNTKDGEDDAIIEQEQPRINEPVTFVCSDIWFGSFRVTGSYDKTQNNELVVKSQTVGKPVNFDGGAVSTLGTHYSNRQDCLRDRETSEENVLLHDPKKAGKDTTDPKFEDDGQKAGQIEKADDEEKLHLKSVVVDGIRKIFDMFQASCKEQKHLPGNVSSKDEESSILLTSRMLVAIGLMNDTTEFDNFLSAIIQSLWHARRFQHEIILRAASPHLHIGIPCVLCGIYTVFSAPSAPMATSKLLRAALSELYCYIGFFEKEHVNAASKVVKAVFDCLHQSSAMNISHCASNACLDHTVFQMKTEKSCCCFKLTDEESRFFLNLIGNNPQEKSNCRSNFSNERLKLEVIKHESPSNPEEEEWRNDHPTVTTFSTTPQIIAIVLEWRMYQNAAERSESLNALSTSLGIGVLYPCLDSGNKYCLVSAICNRGRHYHCFAYSREHEGWVLYNGTTVTVIGEWIDVIARWKECNLLPQVLFFEAG